MNNIFEFNLKPKYIAKNINYKKAYLKNILRSIYVNKVRFIKKTINYYLFKKSISKIKTINDLDLITSLTRPGKLQYDKK